ncbi:MAG TPA: hypothetical protein VL147_05090 [Devosia sp.]|nr:hypothetical protein [Devosia sp.]
MLLAVERLGAKPSTSVDYREFKFELGLKWVPPMKVHILQDGKLAIGPADKHINDALGHKTYSDTEKVPLEAQLADIIVSYAVQGERAWREWRDRNAEYERREALRKAEQRECQKREAEEALAQKLEEERLALIAAAIAEAGRWRDAELLRQYASAFIASTGDTGHADWLRSIADEIDPLTKTEAHDVRP